MRAHFDVLGWLHVLWGVFGVLTGASLLIIATGAVLSAGELGDSSGPLVPTVILLLAGGLLLGLSGLVMIGVGRSLKRRNSGSRLAALLCVVPNLIVIPFGTALGLYTCWVLLNDDARHAFGRPPRASHTMTE